MSNIQWFPGHMTKARRMMEENIKLIDIVIELVDSRAPLSSRNPMIDEIAKNKFRLILLNKKDMADERITKAWEKYFNNQEIEALSINALKKNHIQDLQKKILEVCQEKIERDRKRGIKNRPIRCMIVGIPNVGKSTMINSFVGRASAKTGNMPGVTKGKQWITVNKQIELLDTPGILWPKFEDQEIGKKLALIGTIKDEILNIEELALDGIERLWKDYPNELKERYQITKELSPIDTLIHIGQVRQCIEKGGQISLFKAANLFIDDLRSLRIGKISLERPVINHEEREEG